MSQAAHARIPRTDRPGGNGPSRRARQLLVGVTAAAALLPATAASADQIDLGLSGSADIHALSADALPVSGEIGGELTETGAFSGSLTLKPTNGRLVGSGFLPVIGKIGFVSASPASGSLSDGVFTVRVKVRIKVLDTNLKPIVPLVLGNFCQTKRLSEIVLTSAPGFDAATGGTLTATFANSDFNGCPGLSGLAGPLVAGVGHTMNVTAAPTS